MELPPKPIKHLINYLTYLVMGSGEAEGRPAQITILEAEE